MLTGESVPVGKNAIADKFDPPAGGRNLKFEIPPASHVAMGTAVAADRQNGGNCNWG